MRCNICDSALSKPDFNSDLGTWEPCVTCLEVIQDAVGAFYEKPYADEDAFGYEPIQLQSPFMEAYDDFA